MAPEVFVGLRLLGLTAEGMWNLARAISYEPETWVRLLEYLEEGAPDPDRIRRFANYWNNHRLAKEHTNG